MTETNSDITTTVIDDGDLYTVVVSDSLRAGILDYHLTYEAAFNDALSYLSKASQDPPIPLPQLIVMFRPSSKHRKVEMRPHPNAPSWLIPYYRSDQLKVRLSNDAWDAIQKQTARFKYDGTGPYHGSTHFLAALMRANPDPTYWTDTRPRNLRMYDQSRLNRGRFPFWSSAQDIGLDLAHTRRLQRGLNPIHIQQMLPTLTALSDHFMIAPYSSGQMNPLTRALTVLECYGLTYLTPQEDPPPHPRPANADRRRYRANRLRNKGPELVF